MLSLLQSPLGFATMPGHHGHPEENPCHDMIAKSALNTVAGDTAQNAIEGKVANLPCFEDNADVSFAPQAGADVSQGSIGMIDSSALDLIDGDLKAAGLCAVNVHWHEGAEHRSADEYDEDGSGPGLGHHRRLAAGAAQRQGHYCHKYDPETWSDQQKAPYHFEYCKNMHVGETYEVHWPHSAAGACGTKWQFQSPFYDGVLCNNDAVFGVYNETGYDKSLRNMGKYVGVEGQVFTIVNDAAYDRNLGLAGAIRGGELWQDVARYTGSTTGQSRNNEICSVYSPITWHVDRKCHLISAKSFDMLCAQMKMQADDPNDGHDLEPHGARETVLPELTASNIVDGGSRM